MKKGINCIAHIILIGFSFICIVPLILLISTSFTAQSDLVEYGVRLIPQKFVLDSYKILFSDFGQVLQAYKISIIVTVLGTIIDIFMCALVAYPLSRGDFRYGQRGAYSGNRRSKVF